MNYFVYTETFTIPSDRSGMIAICSICSAGSKMGCVELSNFHFIFFCQPMKKFEFFGVTRATRQRHSKTSSTGDELKSFMDHCRLSSSRQPPSYSKAKQPYEEPVCRLHTAQVCRLFCVVYIPLFSLVTPLYVNR